MYLPSLLQNPVFLALMIPIVAIVVWGIVSVICMIIRHQERMAMIDRGIHPDHPPVDEEKRRERER